MLVVVVVVAVDGIGAAPVVVVTGTEPLPALGVLTGGLVVDDVGVVVDVEGVEVLVDVVVVTGLLGGHELAPALPAAATTVTPLASA